MQVSRIAARFPLLLFAATLTSCGGCSLGMLGGVSGPVTLLSYNVENLFDDVHNGTEYREYDPAEGEWNTELFHVKMQHVAEVLRAAVRGGADIVALEEIENENAAETLNDTYLKGLGYRVFTGESGRTAATVALFSRFPVTEIRIHHLVSAGSEPLRDIMEAHLDCRGNALVVFLNHWKSKLGGAEPTESERRASAGLLVRRIRALVSEEPRAAVVVAGDLNENWDEYARCGGGYQTALLPDVPGLSPGGEGLFVAVSPKAARISENRVVFYSPWAESEEPGSYCYGGRWETIDHILAGPKLFDGTGLEYRSFSVVRPEFLLTGEGYPLKWDSDRLSGYSDHLPVLLTLSILS